MSEGSWQGTAGNREIETIFPEGRSALKVLGIHIGHDSSAALVVDGRIVADVAEERFARVKHYCGLPIKSIQYCLSSQGLGMEDIDKIAIPSAGRVPFLNYLLNLRGAARESSSFPRQVMDLASASGLFQRGKIAPPLSFKTFHAPESVEIIHVEHHLAHAASAYLTSGSSEKQLIVTMDGSGDGFSTCLWRGEGSTITPLEKHSNKGSLGLFYGNVTEALGWTHGDGEGKTMGLAPYGDSRKAKGVLDRFHPKFGGGKLLEPHDYGQVCYWNENGSQQWHLEESINIRELIERHGREHIAAEAQRILEEQAAELIHPWLERERTKRLSCAGGIFLNVKLNQRIWESGKVEEQNIFPNAGDSGLAAGAALYVFCQSCPGDEHRRIESLSLGPEYTDQEIEEVLKARNLRYSKVSDPAEFAARELANDKIVAWFQGRMESGPRALGNRSILMSANKAENKDILNARVKFREAFRPFCPSLLWEKRVDYMKNVRDELYMITSFGCQEDRMARVPAVVHADGTMRPQTVRKEVNPLYWRLINAFGTLTGEYLLLNTSFNIMGEPIVNHPREAIRCFYDNGIDHLVLGSLVLSKGT